MSDDFRLLDPADPRYPFTDGLSGRSKVTGTPGTPPDIRREMGEDTPYPLPEAPPDPADPAAANQQILTLLAFLKTLRNNRWANDQIAVLLESWNRQYHRPVHLPFQHEMPTNGRAMTGLSVGTTINAATTTTLVTLQVPVGAYGFVSLLGMDTQNDILGAGRADWVSLSWDLCVGPSAAQLMPVPGYVAMVGQRGQIEDPTRVRVYVPEGGVAVLRVTNTSGANILSVRGRLDGWFAGINVKMANRHGDETIQV